MRYTEIISEAVNRPEAAVSSHGFWITDEGKLLFNDWDAEKHHSNVATEFLGLSDGEDGIDAGLDRGWLRIIVIPGMELNAQWGERPSKRALKVLLREVLRNEEFPNYFIDGMEHNEDDEIGISRTEFVKILRRHINQD